MGELGDFVKYTIILIAIFGIFYLVLMFMGGTFDLSDFFDGMMTNINSDFTIGGGGAG